MLCHRNVINGISCFFFLFFLILFLAPDLSYGKDSVVVTREEYSYSAAALADGKTGNTVVDYQYEDGKLILKNYTTYDDSKGIGSVIFRKEVRIQYDEVSGKKKKEVVLIYSDRNNIKTPDWKTSSTYSYQGGKLIRKVVKRYENKSGKYIAAGKYILSRKYKEGKIVKETEKTTDSNNKSSSVISS